MANADPFTLMPLPYDENALAPHISARTLQFHYGKHHAAYVNKLNTLVAGTEFSQMKLEEIIGKTAGREDKAALFNNAAQVWNHDFYWKSLSPRAGGKPTGELARKIDAAFSGHEKFLELFVKAGLEQFGSGWVWLVQEGKELKITKTKNAENPLSQKQGTALLTLDVWEHAYYLDFQNRREEYLKTMLQHLVHWEFAAANLRS
jgi:superoxide dismutase, Fe-Mn family